jgi:hypothetical protein
MDTIQTIIAQIENLATLRIDWTDDDLVELFAVTNEKGIFIMSTFKEDDFEKGLNSILKQILKRID